LGTAAGAEAEPLAERALAREVRAREGLVHDGHRRRFRGVAVREDAALLHAHAHRLEIVRGDARDVRGGQLAGWWLRTALESERALPAAQQRQAGAGRLDPGDRL